MDHIILELEQILLNTLKGLLMKEIGVNEYQLLYSIYKDLSGIINGKTQSGNAQ